MNGSIDFRATRDPDPTTPDPWSARSNYARRRRLIDRGYVPTPCVGKRPVLDDWAKIRPDDALLRDWARRADWANTGIVLGDVAAVDIDILEPGLAADLRMAALDLAVADQPPPLVRYGRRPKAALIFRTGSGFAKLATSAYRMPDGTSARVEVLCRGQQLIVAGIHPDTRQPYEWDGGNPGNTSLADLPLLTEDAAQTFIATAAAMIEEAGGQPVRPANNGHAPAAPGGRVDIEAELAALAPGDVHDRALRIVAALVAKGWSDEAVSERLLATIGAIRPPGTDPGKDAIMVAEMCRSARRKGFDPAPKSTVPAAGPQRGVIRLAADRLAENADEAEAAMIAAGLPIFHHGGRLVRPVVEAFDAAHGRSTMIGRLRQMTRWDLARSMAEALRFERFDRRSGTWVSTKPPDDIAELVLNNEGRWRFPPVLGVTTSPTLRPDGSVLVEPGYDAGTKLYHHYDPALILPPELHWPGRADAERALALLADLLAEFPFVGDADRAVALSAFLTAAGRGALATAPLHVFGASTPGTGKSFLCDVASGVVTGRRCPVTTAGASEEEAEKRLGALLLDGTPMVSIDNVNGELAGDALCQMVERTLIQVRILGQSRMATVPVRTIVLATGNNITLRGDLVRRALACRLDAGVERPELRQFSSNPMARVLEDRGTYLGACLTILRAYKLAGMPDRPPRLASYEDWSDWVRGALLWLGEADPVETIERSREEDPVLADLREVIDAMAGATEAGCEYDAAGIIALGQEPRHAVLRAALLRVAAVGTEVSAKRLGNWLTANKGRPVDGRRIVARPRSKRATVYRVEMMAGGE